MKILIFVLTFTAVILALSLELNSLPLSKAWTIEHIKNPDGTLSKYTVMRRDKAVQILACHQMGDGSVRKTLIEDSDSDYVVDIAYRIGVTEEDDRMYYIRLTGIGAKYYDDWQEEWDESAYWVEKLTGRPLRQANAASGS
jgi:hypothetical protein